MGVLSRDLGCIMNCATGEGEIYPPRVDRGLDTGGCCGRRKALLPGRVPHVRPTRPGLPWGVRGPKTTGDPEGSPSNDLSLYQTAGKDLRKNLPPKKS
jgi:hypothetical protein